VSEKEEKEEKKSEVAGEGKGARCPLQKRTRQLGASATLFCALIFQTKSGIKTSSLLQTLSREAIADREGAGAVGERGHDGRERARERERKRGKKERARRRKNSHIFNLAARSFDTGPCA